MTRHRKTFLAPKIPGLTQLGSSPGLRPKDPPGPARAAPSAPRRSTVASAGARRTRAPAPYTATPRQNRRATARQGLTSPDSAAHTAPPRHPPPDDCVDPRRKRRTAPGGPRGGPGSAGPRPRAAWRGPGVLARRGPGVRRPGCGARRPGCGARRASRTRCRLGADECVGDRAAAAAVRAGVRELRVTAGRLVARSVRLEPPRPPRATAATPACQRVV